MNRVRIHSPMVNRLDQLFQAFAGHDFPGMTSALPVGFPPLNIWEDKDSYTLEAELPGFTGEQINIDVLGAQVTISGERSKLEVTEGTQVIRQERVSNKFERTIELPTAVDPDKVEASLTAGVLTVKFAKPEAVKPTKVVVKTNS